MGAMVSCKGDQKKTKAAPMKPAATNAPAAKVDSYYNLPSLPQAEMKKLFDEATYVDYIFYDLPFSVSQDNKASIHANLNMISPEKMNGISKSCKPIGREFFHIGGEIVYEADLYFSEGCFGYIFLKDEKPTYANKLSAEGGKFYSNLIKQSNQIATGNLQNK
jgi:hypothetical protein